MLSNFLRKKKDEFTLFKEKKTTESKLKRTGLDKKTFKNGIECGNCKGVFIKFSEVYIDRLKIKVPCCPLCNSDMLETEMKIL